MLKHPVMSELLLTFIVPVYNTERYLERCLSSIVGQGLPEGSYEVLVVDDGSTDGSRDQAAAFTLIQPQVHLIIQKNSGVSAARNRALEQARGRYVQFVDSDDYLQEGTISRLLQRAVDEDLDVLQFNYTSVDTLGKNQAVLRNDNYPTTPVMTGVEYLESHAMTPYVWRFILRRDYLNQLSCRFDTSLIVCEDGALIARFLLNANRVAQDATQAYCYMNRGDSAMHNNDLDYLRRRLLSQVDSASSIDKTIREFEAATGRQAPISVSGVRNVYLYFAMTKALTSGCVDEVVARVRQAGLYPFPCVGPEANYFGKKWRFIHRLMMHPHLWSLLSRIYRFMKK